jgi:hypothetical protein
MKSRGLQEQTKKNSKVKSKAIALTELRGQ